MRTIVLCFVQELVLLHHRARQGTVKGILSAEISAGLPNVKELHFQLLDFAQLLGVELTISCHDVQTSPCTEGLVDAKVDGPRCTVRVTHDHTCLVCREQRFHRQLHGVQPWNNETVRHKQYPTLDFPGGLDVLQQLNGLIGKV